MKLPNGFGSVYKLSGRRRRPWVAAKTFGWEFDEKGQKVKQNWYIYSTICDGLDVIRFSINKYKKTHTS